MSEVVTNDTGCEVSVSHITGDVVCQVPGPECDCLIVAVRDELPTESVSTDCWFPLSATNV
jgi:hypothetical protein